MKRELRPKARTRQEAIDRFSNNGTYFLPNIRAQLSMRLNYYVKHRVFFDFPINSFLESLLLLRLQVI